MGSGITGLGAAYHLITCAEGASCFVFLPLRHISKSLPTPPCLPCFVFLPGDVEVTVYEAAATAGGHAHTEWVTDEKGQKVACDCGFMVFNHQNYPNMVELFAELDVEDEVSGWRWWQCGRRVRMWEALNPPTLTLRVC